MASTRTRILAWLALLVALPRCESEQAQPPVNITSAFTGVHPGMTDHDVIARLGTPTDSDAGRDFVRDSALWTIRDSRPEPVRYWSDNMTDEELARTMAPGDTTYSRTDTWERWDDSPPEPHMSTWLVFYMKENGEWRVTSTDDRSSGIVF